MFLKTQLACFGAYGPVLISGITAHWQCHASAMAGGDKAHSPERPTTTCKGSKSEPKLPPWSPFPPFPPCAVIARTGVRWTLGVQHLHICDTCSVLVLPVQSTLTGMDIWTLLAPLLATIGLYGTRTGEDRYPTGRHSTSPHLRSSGSWSLDSADWR